ncbi:hypothetical protein V8J82_16930 [Gymnodinialimonas sp. 2305UL16-5]|uniref:hypothetical protein n=1 Tax=Gymnodinialimonas mytili TaxID=3126503 RepID=UPI0030A8559C
MPILIAIAIAVIGFIWWSWGRHRVGGEVATRLDALTRRRACKWSATGDRNGRFVEYRCETCGKAAYSRTGSAPTACQRNQPGKGGTR